MQINLKGFFFVLALGIVSGSVLADTPVVTGIQSTQDQTTQSIQSSQSSIGSSDIQLASEWGLTLKQYQRYTWLMTNTPSGHWYKDLDPAEVLALNAESHDDMMTYAKVQAKNAHDRVSRELAFDRMYTLAYRQEYPDEKAIQSPMAMNEGHSALQAGDRIWLFLSPDTPLGPFVYEHLMTVIEATPNTALDLYFVGDHVTAKSIQSWAKTNGVSEDLINKELTLNYGNDRFNKATQDKNPSLPFIGRLRDGHFQSITLSSVLS